MIITITNANFANCSIGQSTTWPITYSIGTGATKTGTTSVTKDGSFSATITLKSGYEWSGSTTVTMGGSPVSNAVSINGDTITITISKVTGAVRISQATSKVNTGGGDSGDTVLTIDVTTKEYKPYYPEYNFKSGSKYEVNIKWSELPVAPNPTMWKVYTTNDNTKTGTAPVETIDKIYWARNSPSTAEHDPNVQETTVTFTATGNASYVYFYVQELQNIPLTCTLTITEK